MVLTDTDMDLVVASPIHSNGLVAVYSLGQTPAGEWFAIGSVRSTVVALNHPAWIIVSTGTSKEATVEALQAQLEVESRRLISWDLPDPFGGQGAAAD
ncbi:MAG TPA: hypothetical protein VFV93_14465 [Thermomicrobiales bacterium]|nr:hypothetical protein [Thermomicrobiales bacterium]